MINHRKLIRIALTQRCEDEQNYSLNIFERAWYTFKAIVCILFNRPDVIGYDVITVGVFNGRYYYSEDCVGAYQWQELQVSEKGWRFSVIMETNC